MNEEKNRKLSAKEQKRLSAFKKQDESKEILIYDHPTQAYSSLLTINRFKNEIGIVFYNGF